MKISACMIVKDESRVIERCLLSLVYAVDEIIVVDTGSSDDTISIIETLSMDYPHIKLYSFDWCDDFSIARNYSLSHVTGDWAFIIDADEYLYKNDGRKMRKVLSNHHPAKEPIGLTLDFMSFRNGNLFSKYEDSALRVFPIGFNIKFHGKIHETILDDISTIISSNLSICTDGYDPNVVDIDAKTRRNILLINSALDDDPENGVLLFYLGRETAHFDKDLGNMILQQASLRLDKKTKEYLKRFL